MSKPVSESDKKGVLSSVRRLVDGSAEQDGPPEKLVLSSDLRVTNANVLRLGSQHAVKPENGRESRDASVETDPKNPAVKQGAPVNATEADLARSENAPKTVPKTFGINELTAKIAALETTIARTSDQWEPDGMSRDAYSGTRSNAMSWQDSVELDAKGTPVAEDRKTITSDSSPEPAPSQVVDEKILRDLVAEIVRSELQGALGERITQNLRKLVRREIHRALAARDLG